MKISYQKRWSENGTVYTQSIRMTETEFSNLQGAVYSEISLKYPRKAEYVQTPTHEMYLKPLHQSYSNKRFICYLNHTQTKFINLFCKLKLKDRNTLILIN